MSSDTNRRSVNRRKVIQTLGAAGALGLAGCSEGESEDAAEATDEADLGERVPVLTMEYWSNSGQANVLENLAPIAERDIEEAIGAEIDLRSIELSTSVNQISNDERESHIGLWNHLPNVQRTDPDALMTDVGEPTFAGAGGQFQTTNWADCEYGRLLREQRTAADEETRQEAVNEALTYLSENKVVQPLLNVVEFHVIDTNRINTSHLGEVGFSEYNPFAMINSEPIDSDQIVMPTFTTTLETTNQWLTNAGYQKSIWSEMVHSPLTEYDENQNRVNMLAEEVTVEDDFQQVTVTLRENTTFHNGDPITAEDVEFTYSLPLEIDLYQERGFEVDMSIEVLDDRTVEFNFDQPHPTFMTMALPAVGIQHKASWEDEVDEAPEEAEMDPIIGSGPYEVENLSSGDNMVLTPHDDHPVFSPGHDVVLIAHRGAESKMQAFQAGDLDVNTFITPEQFDELVGEDHIESASNVAYTPFILYPQASFAPGKFTEFRDALGKCVNRQEMNDIALFGESDPQMHGSVLQPPHTWMPPLDTLYHYTDDPTGDNDAARQVLSDAGWGWNEDGNLHYPQDADLDPIWPEGEMPDAEYGFECIEDGEWVG